MVDTIDLSHEEKQRRTVLIHKLTQGTLRQLGDVPQSLTRLFDVLVRLDKASS
jgi:hypothetical protein